MEMGRARAGRTHVDHLRGLRKVVVLAGLRAFGVRRSATALLNDVTFVTVFPLRSSPKDAPFSVLGAMLPLPPKRRAPVQCTSVGESAAGGTASQAAEVTENRHHIRRTCDTQALNVLNPAAAGLVVPEVHACGGHQGGLAALIYPPGVTRLSSQSRHAPEAFCV